MLLCSLTASAHDFEVGGIYYNITSSDDMTVAVTYRGPRSNDFENEYSGSIIIPSTVNYNSNTYHVTSIGYSALEGCNSLTSITIPGSVTSIEGYAFNGCSSLTAITIPKNVTSIANGAFSGCCSITSMIVAKDNKVFDSRNGCNAIIYTHSNSLLVGCMSTVIPNDITSIWFSAFEGCSNLTTITIPESVTCIEGYAFQGCSSLTAITIPKDVTKIGFDAFRGCSSLTSIIIPDGVTSIETRTFYGCSNLTSIILPNGIMSIENYAFDGCSNLTSITMSESLTSIGDGAFYGCCSLTSITLPKSLMDIGVYAFFGCSSLTSITIPDNVVSVRDCAFRGCSSLTSVSIPNGLIDIGELAFYQCSSLTTINIPDGVTSIGRSAFEGCNKLTSAVIPESSKLASIGESAFSGCNSLETITIPEGVTSIGESAFSDCSNLVSINLPNGLTSIEGLLFYRCSGLKSITIPKNVTTILGRAFFNCSSLTTITIPKNSELTSIGFDAFFGCTSLESIVIPEGVTSIRESAFADCSNLVSITFSKNSKLTSIGYSAFFDCASLESIVIPEGVTSIGYNAFEGCSNLDSITFSENSKLTSIESRLFSGCTSLKSITIPDGVTSIGKSAFEGCYRLASVNIPMGISEIGSHAFFECRSLASSITIPHGVVAIGDYTFYNCSKLISVNIPESVTNIGEHSFYNCGNLTSITLPNSVAQIGVGAFSNCIKLNSINIPEGINSIESSVFAFCESLTSITIPESVTSVGNAAFYFCENLKDVYCNAETVPTTDEMAFASSSYMSATLYVPTSAIESYKSTVPWSHFGTIVSLTDEKVTSITLSHTTATLTEGDELTLTAIVTPDYATDTSVTWNSSNTDVAIVDNNGVITAIAPGTTTISATANDGSGVSASCEVIIEERITSLVIVDPYTEDYFIQDKTEENIIITYTRTFSDTQWQALYVPFEIPITEEFLVNFEVADINNVHQYDYNDDNVTDETVIEAFKVTSGTLEANYPYLIRAKETGEKTIMVTDATLYTTEENSIDCSSVREKFTFTGTYSRMSYNELTPNEGYYTLNNGEWQPMTEGAALEVFRFYLKVDSRNSHAMMARTIRMRIVGENDDNNKFTLTVSAAEYATLYLGYAVEIPDNVEVYYASSVEDDRLKMIQVKGVLPANTGVIVKAKAGDYTFTQTEDTPVAIEGNLLVGTTTNEYITANPGYKYYVLAKADDVVGMYLAKLTDGSFLNNANKAYLPLKSSDLGIFDDETNTEDEGGQLSNRLRFDFGGTTGIQNSEFTIQHSELIYDLQGRHITNTEGLKGIYIINGKKMVIK